MVVIMKDMLKYTKNMLEFIEKSPSCFHVVDNIRKSLEKKGFVELREGEEWSLLWGKGYFVIRNDASVIGFKLPEKQEIKGFHIVASHSDSPTFKVKENPEMRMEENYVKLNTEKYGGMILSTWFDRALSVAGRVVCENQETYLVNLDEDLCVIPNVAIHMNRDMNRGVEYNPQVDLLPLYADVKEGKITLKKKIAGLLKVKESEIMGQDLFLYVREKGRILGANKEFVLSPKLDDLQSVYASLKAFEDAKPKDYINVCAVFDNEEVGSGTEHGADSTFLEDVLKRVAVGLSKTETDYQRWVSESFLLSADNAHAVHPNHPEKADPTNRPYLNGGIVLKFHGGQKYTTDAKSAAKVRTLCKEAGVPCQNYANRSDIAGGSTLGNISTAHVSVNSADIGFPQLAMHSAVETAGAKDTYYGILMFKEFYKQ